MLGRWLDLQHAFLASVRTCVQSPESTPISKQTDKASSLCDSLHVSADPSGSQPVELSNIPFTGPPKTIGNIRCLYYDSQQQQNWSSEVATKMILHWGHHSTRNGIKGWQP